MASEKLSELLTIKGRKVFPREEIEVAEGVFKGNTYMVEEDIRNMDGWGNHDSLAMLAAQGNMAALQALEVNEYNYEDAPFYYGKIGNLGYILSHFDITGEKHEL